MIKEHDSPQVVDINFRNLFNDKEVQRLRAFLDERDFWKKRYYNDDGGDEKIGMILWNHPGDDLTGWMARCHRMVDTAEQVRIYPNLPSLDSLGAFTEFWLLIKAGTSHLQSSLKYFCPR